VPFSRFKLHLLAMIVGGEPGQLKAKVAFIRFKKLLGIFLKL